MVVGDNALADAAESLGLAVTPLLLGHPSLLSRRANAHRPGGRCRDAGGGGLWLVPDTRGTCGTGGGFRHGEYTYPPDAKYGANAADLVEARFTSRHRFRARFRFQTLIDASTTAAAALVIVRRGGPRRPTT